VNKKKDSAKTVLHVNDEAFMDCFNEFFDSLTSMSKNFAVSGEDAELFIRQCISLI